MTYTESAIVFGCRQESLTGILAQPSVPAFTGVIVIVGGPQYRAGSHRQFVLLSRALAVAGHAVLRFDYRGMGDSTGAQGDFLSVTPDISVAIDVLQRAVPSVKRIALWGLCDGASAALLYCNDTSDPRIGGLCLLNPWVRSETSLARAHVKHYYRDRLKQKDFWTKLLSGKVAVSALTGLWHNIRMAVRRSESAPASQDQPFQKRMANAWARFDNSILLLLSGDDYTAKEFVGHASNDAAWAGLLERPNVLRHDLPEADHTFSDIALRTKVEVLTTTWLRELRPR